MKKLLFILLSALSLTAFAQKPKLAVYMTGDNPINEIVSNRLVDDLARNNEYTTVERTASFLSALSKEHKYERSGEVNDEQIAALGKQFNVQYVCVASALDIWGEEKYITARIIDAETAEVVASGSSNGSIKTSSDLIGALNTLSKDFLKAMHYNKQSNAKKVAVYVTKTGNRDVDIVLGDQLVSGFAKSGRYAAIERTGGFLRKIKEEQGYQQSGAVDDDDLTRLGQQFGVNYVCVVKTTAWAGDYFISTRMIDVKTGEVVNSNKVEGARLNNSRDVVKVAQGIAAELSKGTFAEQAEEARLAKLRAEEEARRRAEAERLAEQRRKEAEARAKQEKINKLKNRHWRDLLDSRITTVTNKYSYGWYVGQWGEGNLNGLGLFYWNDGDTYFGRYEKGDKEGMGIYIAKYGYTINNCSNGTVYVGEWKNDKKHGKGTVYDKNGKLIYYGKFLWDKPTGKYPSEGYSEYSFEVINYNNGDKYVGEMKNGVMHGKGVHIWTEERGIGVFWYGTWANGIRDGYGMYVYDKGKECITGTWKGNKKL